MKLFQPNQSSSKNSQTFLGFNNIKSFSAIQFVNWNELHQKLCSNLNEAKCPHGSESVFMCFSQNCKNNALICGLKMCKCKQTHLNCFHHIQTISFVKNLENQYRKQAKLMKEVEQKFDQLIDEVSLLREQILTRMKYSFFRPKELSLIEWVEKSEYNKITGAYLKSLLNDIYDKNEERFMKERNAITMSKVVEISHSIKSSLTKIKDSYLLYKEFKPAVTSYGQMRFSSGAWESKILSTQDQIKTLEEFMPDNKLSKLTLLYRASENGFQVNKFFELCEDITPTLIVIKTVHDKIIGGFTPIPWVKHKEKNQSADNSKQTFLFSLTNKQKLSIKNSDYATYYYAENWGPVFGRIGYPDLSIYNKANESSKGNWIFRAKNFTHENYVNATDPEIYKMFTGSSTEDFQIQDWEVFQVDF